MEVVLVDEDNIKAGDPPVELGRDWEALARDAMDISDERIVRIV